MRIRNVETSFILSLAVLFGIILTTPSQGQTLFQTPFDSALTAVLYDAVESDSGIAWWAPNFSERMELFVEEGMLCETRLDTVFFFPDRVAPFMGYPEENAVAVFVTENCGIDNHCADCLPAIGIALLHRNADGPWEVTSFNKNVGAYGSLGKPYPLYAVRFSDSEDLPRHVAVDYSWSLHGGYAGATTDWFRVDGGSIEKILDVQTSWNGAYRCDPEDCSSIECERYEEIVREITIDRSPDGSSYADILVTTEQRYCDQPWKSYVERYRYDGIRYERVCEPNVE